MNGFQRTCTTHERSNARFRTLLRRLGFACIVLGMLVPPGLAQGPGPSAIRLRGVENLGIAPSPGKTAMGKVDPDLLVLHAEYQAHLKQTSGQGPAAPVFQSSNAIAPIAGGSVVVDTAASGDPQALASDLRALGASKVTVFGRMVSAHLAIPAIPALEGLSSLQFARPAYAITQIGDVTSQGDRAMRADTARSAFGVDGTGVMVGVMSDSYNCLGGASAGVASGDLPAGVLVLEEIANCTGATDEARALAEIVHDIAPGAAIAAHTAFNGQANFAQGILDLANAGAKVITDDVIYFAEPFYQDGIVAQAVNTVKGMGVSYFSSAGNADRKAYESSFRPSGRFFDIGFGPSEAHDFDPGTGVDVCQQITIPSGRTLVEVFQWDQPFFSVSGAPGSASDIDIVLTNAACDTLFAGSAAANVGGDPLEVFGFTNTGSTANFGIIILRLSGPNPGLMKTVNVGSGSITINQFDTRTGASWGHSAALGGLGVGAADYRDTPEFGQNPPLIEGFSSAGGTPILFDTAGNRLATPEIRQQPDITAPDGTDTTFFGSDTDGTGFPNFFGTSASAPHAAGVAALMKDLVSTLTPDATYAALKTTAIDMAATGFDFDTGFGLIQADDALDAVAPPPLRADLAVTMADSPDPGAVGERLAYTLTVTNNGPDAATGVQITDPLPAAVQIAGLGTNCRGTPVVVCDLGTLASGASATVTIETFPTGAGTIPNQASVGSNVTDPVSGNNSASTSTTVNANALVLPQQQSEQGNTCTGKRCRVRLSCAVGTTCTNAVTLRARDPRGRLAEDASARAPRLIRIATASVTNVPPGVTQPVRLDYTPRGRRVVRALIRNGARRLRARIEIQSSFGARVTAAPITLRLR